MARLSHPHDTAAAQFDPGAPRFAERIEPIVEAVRPNHAVVVFARRIDVVVIVVETGIRESFRLPVAKHPKRRAGFESKILHRADNGCDVFDVSILGPAPGGSHAKTGRSELFRRPGGCNDLFERQQRLRVDTRSHADRLGAVTAILGTTTRLYG